MLFAIDSTSAPTEQVIRDFWREMPGNPEGKPYADRVVRGVMESLEQTDEWIRLASRNWRLERMTRVDRNLLRIGAHELHQCQEVPRAVIIDEAVELAKRFGTEESSAFVNGVLDRIADDCGRVDLDRPAAGKAGAGSLRRGTESERPAPASQPPVPQPPAFQSDLADDED